MSIKNEVENNLDDEENIFGTNSSAKRPLPQKWKTSSTRQGVSESKNSRNHISSCLEILWLHLHQIIWPKYYQSSLQLELKVLTAHREAHLFHIYKKFHFLKQISWDCPTNRRLQIETAMKVLHRVL